MRRTPLQFCHQPTTSSCNVVDSSKSLPIQVRCSCKRPLQLPALFSCLSLVRAEEGPRRLYSTCVRTRCCTDALRARTPPRRPPPHRIPPLPPFLYPFALLLLPLSLPSSGIPVVPAFFGGGWGGGWGEGRSGGVVYLGPPRPLLSLPLAAGVYAPRHPPPSALCRCGARRRGRLWVGRRRYLETGCGLGGA